MKPNLFADVNEPLNEREMEQNLRGMAYSVEEGSYLKPFSDEEMAEAKGQLSEISIRRAVLEDQYKKIADEFKSKIKNESNQFKETLMNIKQRGVMVDADLFLIDDQENKVMDYYAPDGTWIQNRPLRPNERQLSISTSGNNVVNFN
jgi:hypothetical protein